MNNYRKKQIISRLAPWLSQTGFSRLLRPFYGGAGHILTFHRVIPDPNTARIHNHQSLEISPQHLEAVIRYFVQRNYRFYDLDQVKQGLEQGAFTERFVVFTFDDGYEDVYRYAWPVFQRHQVPFTIYVSTNFPDKTAVLWWYMLEKWVIRQSEINFSWQGGEYHFASARQAEKEAAFARIRTLILQQPTQEQQMGLLHSIFGAMYESLHRGAQSMSMDWEQIRQLSEDPLVTIGAHTQNHLPLSQISENQLIREVAGSKQQIEKEIQKEVRHFAYPFGKRTEASLREFKAAQEAGFHTATTTRIGNIFSGHHAHPMALPRISINRATDPDVLTLQTHGLIPAVVNKGKKLITD